MDSFSLLPPFELKDANITFSNVPENDYPAYVAGTFSLGQRCMLITANNHYIYESLIGANTVPPDITQKVTTNWLRVSSTNKYKMFDQSIASQTQNAEYIECKLTNMGRFNAIYLGNLSASAVEITITNATNAVIYTKIFSLIPKISRSSWWSYFYEKRVRSRDLYIDGLPFNASSNVNLKIINTGDTAKCGILLIGVNQVFGAAQYGAKFGIDDYSIKDKNAYGDISITERAYNKHINLTLWVETAKVDALANTLADYRAKFVLYRAAPGFSSLIAYGYFQSFEGVISYPTHSIFTIDIQGIT